MYPLHTISNMEDAEREYSEQHFGETRLVIILIAQPSLADGKDILSQFNSIHYQSGKYCVVYAPGYSAFGFPSDYVDSIEVAGVNRTNWWYSDRAFWETISQLEDRIQWRFSGESEMLLLQSKFEGRSSLNFQNYISLQITQGIRKSYYESFPRLMTKIITASKKYISPSEVIFDVAKRSVNIKDIVSDALCELIPGDAGKTAARALKDNTFFITAAMAARKHKKASNLSSHSYYGSNETAI